MTQALGYNYGTAQAVVQFIAKIMALFTAQCLA